MSDLNNFPITLNKDLKNPEVIPNSENSKLRKIHDLMYRNNGLRSQSAPLEQDNNDNNTDFLNSYNYYLFYHSKNPRDPHLPKPTYVPKPDLADIKESKDKDEEEQSKLSNDKQLETINQMMNNLNFDKSIDINKLLNDEFQNENTNNNSNNKFGMSNNSNNSNVVNYNGNKLNNENANNMPLNLNSEVFGNANFNLYNFVNNDNISSTIPNNKINKMDDSNINRLGNNISFNPSIKNMFDNSNNSLNNMYSNNNVINKSNNINLNNNNINNDFIKNNNNNNLVKMMLLQNMQKDQNSNFNINYFNQQINNNNILLNNFNNNHDQLNPESNFNFPISNSFQNNNTNNFMNYNPNQKNYPNLFSKNKRKYPNNNFNNINNRLQNPNNFNINPKFFPPKNPKSNSTLKNITGISEFTNNQKRDLTDIKHLEDLIQTVLQLKSNLNNNNNEISSYQMNDIVIDMINKYKSEILNLAKDVTGNYAIQKMLNNKKAPEVNFIIESLENNIYELTLNLYGCRCVQELISILDESKMYIVTSELKPYYEKCIQDKNGNHVIQKLIEKVNNNDLNEIYLVAVNNIIYFSRHQYGCRVIQRLFKYCNETQIKHMLNNLFLNINELIQDQYGNYVIQFILENQAINIEDLNPIFLSLKGRIYQYSFHKYASNVIERCITFGNEHQKMDIINEVYEFTMKDEELIINMVRDKFANYVVQKIIEFSKNEIQQKLINIILSRQNRIKNEGFSKHVLNYIEKINNGINKGNKFKNNNNIYKQFI